MQLNHVPAKTGYLWFRQGLGIFRRSPLIFVTLFFAYLFAMRLIALPPVIGSIVLLLLIPGVSVGFLAASRDVLAGKPAFPTVLISGFRAHGPLVAKRLLILGVAYAIAIALVLALSAIVDGGTLAKIIMFGSDPSDLAKAGDGPDGADGAALLSLLAYVPVAMLFWFAPVLVAWHDVPPIKAMFFSWVACWRNKAAFVVYGCLWMVTSIAVSLVLMIVLQLLGAGTLAFAMLLPVSAILTAVLYCSFYATYRGCFEVDGPELPTLGTPVRPKQ